jgi:hypothetical protein
MMNFLIVRCSRWVGQSDQFSGRIFFFRERSSGLGVHDGQHVATKNSPDYKVVTFNGDNPVLLVED